MKQLFVLITILISLPVMAQGSRERDSIFGSITAERAWWDLVHYDLQVEVFPDQRTIRGSNQITFRVLEQPRRMQIDLQQPMEILSVSRNGQPLSFERRDMFYYIDIPTGLGKGQLDSISIQFEGKPRIAQNPPWDGGFTWSEDSNGLPFIATSNQGIGSSIWWPNKDHPYDEPDMGVDLKLTVPAGLQAVGNGRLKARRDEGDRTTFHWKVVNPINNYGVNINVGDYVRFGEQYEGEAGTLDMDYWVLRENEEKARKQFKQAPMMMEAFEHWFGPYPFYEDSFKLVEVPYLGMEHQSSVTYGNGYQNGYRGYDLSGTGWGLKFDFIIIHEAGHEWFANNITNDDVADMWIHEGFTAYSENLYLDYHFGKEAAAAYVIGTRTSIQNDSPIIGERGFRNSGSNDKYYKGANILHTLRQLIEDDTLWRSILRGLNEEFRHQTISSAQLERYISEKSGKDLTAFWEQYLRTTNIPVVEYRVAGSRLFYRYSNTLNDFDMPVVALINGETRWLFPEAEWKELRWKRKIGRFTIKEDFYVEYKEVQK